MSSRPVALGFGASKSSVESLKLLRASLSEKSDRFELRLRMAGLGPGPGLSIEVEKRFVGGRWRNCALSSPVNTRRIPGTGGDDSLGDKTSSAMMAMVVDDA